MIIVVLKNRDNIVLPVYRPSLADTDSKIAVFL